MASPLTAETLARKCATAGAGGLRGNQALAGVLSTRLRHRIGVRDAAPVAAARPGIPVTADA